MPSYHAPIKDIKFILQNVLEINDSEIPGYSELDNEYLNAILEEASKISTELIFFNSFKVWSVKPNDIRPLSVIKRIL